MDGDEEGEREYPQLVDLCTEVKEKAHILVHKNSQYTYSCHIFNIVIQETDLNALTSTLEKGFKKKDGPFVKALDTALASFNVRRQAFYSGTFIGNHVHRTLEVKLEVISPMYNKSALQVQNTEWLCNSLIVLAQRFRSTIRADAERISRKF